MNDILGCSVHWSAPDSVSLQKLIALGVKYVRRDLTWQDVESPAGNYNWASFDSVLDSVEGAGLTMVWILDYGNTLHTGQATHLYPPRTTPALEAWREYCRRAAVRYAGRRVIFEVWNEPDQTKFWPPAPSLAELKAVYDYALDGLRAGNPLCKVVSSGFSKLTASVFGWLDDLEANGYLSRFDGIGHHLYPTVSWSNQPEERLAEIARMNAISVRVDKGEQSYCTEFGHSSSNTVAGGANGLSVAGREWQAQRVCRSVLNSWIGGLKMHVIYDDRDDGTNAADSEHNFGLLDYSYANKPAYTYLLNLTQSLNGAAYKCHRLVGTYSRGALRVEAEKSNGAKVTVIWTFGPLGGSFVLASDDARSVRRLDGTSVAGAAIPGGTRYAIGSEIGVVIVS